MKIWTCALFVSLFAGMLHAELPHVDNGEWRGCFAAHEASRYDFIMKYTGEMHLIPKRRDKDPVAVANRIKIEYGIEELQPDGSTIFKKTRNGSLVSEHEADARFDKITFQGTTTGDAVYEVIIEQSRDIISVGGRVVEKGELTEHPVRFTLRVTLPNTHRNLRLNDRDDERDFEKKTRRDYLEVVRVDHSKVELTTEDSDELDGAKLTGSGIQEVEMRLSYYEGRRFFFLADKESGMAVTPGFGSGAWFEGFTLHWTSDSSKDPESKARLNMWIK